VFELVHYKAVSEVTILIPEVISIIEFLISRIRKCFIFTYV